MLLRINAAPTIFIGRVEWVAYAQPVIATLSRNGIPKKQKRKSKVGGLGGPEELSAVARYTVIDIRNGRHSVRQFTRRLSHRLLNRSMIRFSIVTETQFQLEYDGEAVATGLMDVRDLAPALLGLGDLLEAVNEELNGDLTSVKAFADANFKTGSFDVNLRVIQDFIGQIKGFIGSQDVKDAEEVIKTAGVAGKEAWLGFLSLKKWLSGRSIEQKSEPDDDGRIRVSISGDVKFTKEEVLKLLGNDKANQAAERIISPLAHPGIDSVRFRDRQHVDTPITLEKSDITAYTTAPRAVEIKELQDQQITERSSSRLTRIWVLEPSFIRGNKWLVEEASLKFYVDIDDNEFMDRVSRAEVPFTANTGLDVELAQLLRVAKNGRDTATYTVKKVNEVVYGPDQTLLFS
ncbi:MAG: hypothetical protein JO108_33625 [Acidobacteriaceae bacterium]|nr:hypothetical protein [Acidobacteriaceae bacterium]